MNTPIDDRHLLLVDQLVEDLGALYWMPSWQTYRQAGFAGSYCFGT